MKSSDCERERVVSGSFNVFELVTSLQLRIKPDDDVIPKATTSGLDSAEIVCLDKKYRYVVAT